MIGNKSSVLVIVGMLIFTMVFASWVGADGGDPLPTDPSAELICPTMTDRPCEASGTMASGDANTALKKAVDRCKIEFSKCVETQEKEANKNYEKCTGSIAPKCAYTSDTVSEPCEGNLADNCKTKNGLTTCTVDAQYNRTSYTCTKIDTATVTQI